MKSGAESKSPSQSKVGVYICHCGGNISDHVDVNAVCEGAAKMEGVRAARTNMFMCSDPGQEMIIEDLNSGAVDRVVVASCAPSLHEATFRNALSRAGANPYLYEHANIREQVSWVHHGEAATEKTMRLIAAAVAKARRLKPLDPIRVEARGHATVIGGGIAGLKAAKDLAERGIEVMLVEKSPFLGGRTAALDTLAPTGEKASDLLTGLAGEVLRHPSITVHCRARIDGFEGFIGNFKLRVKKEPLDSKVDAGLAGAIPQPSAGSGGFVPFRGVLPGETTGAAAEFTVETGVIIIATGFTPYRPKFGEYGFGEFEEVVTLPQFIRILAETGSEDGRLRFNGKFIRNIAMVHCVGSRHIPGIHEPDERGNFNEYCSRTCCGATLHAAQQVRERFPGTHVFEFYRDIRAYGRFQEDLYSKAARDKVVFLRFEPDSPPVVAKNLRHDLSPLTVRVKDTLTFGEEIETPADLVVLAVGMEPADVSDLVEMMKLPVGTDRFLLEVHPKLRPVELSVAGIVLAGTCQAPMDAGEASAAASAAAVKASAILARGYVELDPFIAEVDLERCNGTGACVEACLREGALSLTELDVNGEKVLRAHVNPVLCTGCGACVAVCPENAIDIRGWTLDQYEAMVDAIVAGEDAA
ncbi:MAG: CoB--CoM heterodisulfide reductase iron-sulfur subunit A family protein [Syntrophobacteraceae bacterium]